MLEKMGEFFDSRLDIYDRHQLNCIDGAREFLKYTASLLPRDSGSKVLDLGCGTGLELEEYFRVNPEAAVTGVDLAPGMLGRLKEKFRDKNVSAVLGSYFEVPFSENYYDAAVSVESLHHFTAEEKTRLYAKLLKALKDDGAFVLTDYFAASDEEETNRRNELLKLKAKEGIQDGEMYHFDTPLTILHETECLKRAGFSRIEILKTWGATATIRAKKAEFFERG